MASEPPLNEIYFVTLHRSTFKYTENSLLHQHCICTIFYLNDVCQKIFDNFNKILLGILSDNAVIAMGYVCSNLDSWTDIFKPCHDLNFILTWSVVFIFVRINPTDWSIDTLIKMSNLIVCQVCRKNVIVASEDRRELKSKKRKKDQDFGWFTLSPWAKRNDQQ